MAKGRKSKGRQNVKGSTKVSYAEAAKRLRTLQSLPFNNRTNFTPAQKAYISRQYNEQRSAIRAVRRGNATVVHTNDRKARAMSDHYQRVRGGIVVRGIDKGRVVKRDGRYILQATEGDHRMQFRPLKERYGSYDDVHTLAQKIMGEYSGKRYSLMLTVGGVPTTYDYDYARFLQYIAKLDREGAFDQKPFDGIMIVRNVED